VLELAAGLGLPSLVATKHATSVTCSDYLEAPFEFVKASINHHQLQNINCQIINWFALPNNITADVILLSDINYEPTAFAVLFGMITNFIANKKTIILTTPQRLLAKPFIEKLLPFCKVQTQIAVMESEQPVWIQVLVLQP
jgi:predicted nicotinamide N-methyase